MNNMTTSNITNVVAAAMSGVAVVVGVTI